MLSNRMAIEACEIARQYAGSKARDILPQPFADDADALARLNVKPILRVARHTPCEV